MADRTLAEIKRLTAENLELRSRISRLEDANGALKAREVAALRRLYYLCPSEKDEPYSSLRTSY